MKRALSLSAALLALAAIAAPRARASCAVGTTFTVSPGGVQARLNLVSVIGPGDYCITLNPGVYTEQVTIQNKSFADAQSRLIISSAPGAQGTVWFTLANSTGAVFDIHNDSVSLIGVGIRPTAATQYGINASSNSIFVSSVVVTDPSGLLIGAALSASGSLFTLDQSSIASSALSAYGALLSGPGAASAKVSNSTFSANSTGGQSALDVDEPYSIVTNSYIQQLAGRPALSVQVAQNVQVRASSVVVVGGSANPAVYLNSAYAVSFASVNVSAAGEGIDVYNSSGGVLSNLNVTAAGGEALMLENYSNNDLVSLSNLTGSAPAAPAVHFQTFASSNTISYSFITGVSSDGVHMDPNTSNDTISFTTVTVNVGNSAAVLINGSPLNLIANDYFADPNGDALRLVQANNNQISSSTLYNNTTASYCGLRLAGSSNNQISNSFIIGPNGTPVNFKDSLNNTIVQSTMTTGGTASAYAQGNNSNGNAILQSYLAAYGPNGNGAFITSGSNITVVQSTIVATGSNSNGIYFGVSNSTVTQSVIQAPSGIGMQFLTGSAGSVLSFSAVSGSSGVYIAGANGISILNSSVTAAGAGSAAVYLYNSSTNTLANDYLFNTGGDALLLVQANSNQISNSTLYSNQPATYASLRLVGSSSNTVTGSFVLAPGGNPGLVRDGSNYNAISQSTFTSSVNNGGALSILSNANYNTVTQCYMGGYGSGSFGLYVGGPNSSGLLVSQSTAVATNGTGGAAYFDLKYSTITQSVLSAPNGMGVWVQSNNIGSVISYSAIAGSTGVYVSGATGTSIQNSTILGTGNGAAGLSMTGALGVTQVSGSTIAATGARGAGVSILGSPAASSTTIAGSVISGSNTVTYALYYNGNAGSALQLAGGDTFHGNVNEVSGMLTGAGQSVFGGDVWLGTAAVANAGNLSFYGGLENPPRSAQTLSIQTSLWPNFGAVDVSVASFSAVGGSFQSSGFQDNVAGSTVAFAAATSPAFWLTNLSLRGGVGANQRVNFRSLTPGIAMKMQVSVASVTLAQPTDADDSAGSTIQANDGTSVDGGGNTNWNFLPFLQLELAGESFVEGNNKTGSPTAAAAGAVPVTVRALSNSHATVFGSGIVVTLAGNQTYDDTQTQTLVNGTTVFNLVLRRGEPAPVSHTLTATSAGAYSGLTYNDTVNVNPGGLAKLQILLNGEAADPGSPTGKTGALPQSIVASIPAGLAVRGVDAFWNKVTGASDQVMISTSGANLPQTQTLIGGATSFSSIVFASTASGRDVVATDLSSGGVTASTSSAFSVFALSYSSPTVSVNIASGSIQATLGGAITGTASDTAGVTQVRVSLQRISDFNYFNWPSGPYSQGTFNATAVVFATSTLASPGALSTNWSLILPDTVLTSNASYYVTVVSSNASNNQVTSLARFVYQPASGQVGGPGDGQGTATVSLSNNSVGCTVLVASMTFTAGPAGISAGGGVAFHVPANWQNSAVQDSVNNPSPTPGNFVIGSTSAYTVTANPATLGTQTAGVNWLLYNGALAPGQTIFVSFTGYTGAGPQAVGPQTFGVETQGGAGGQFAPIASQPAANLLPGVPAQLQFSNSLPLTLGPLQPSPTMQVLVTDACGNSTNTASNLNVDLLGLTNYGLDAGATFYAAGGAVLGPGLYGAQRSVIPGGARATPGFYFVTSTGTGAGVGYENIKATTTFGSSGQAVFRNVNLLQSSASITNVSVDTGTLAPGVSQATMTAGALSGAAVINFTLSDPSLPWEVLISTSNTNFYPELVHRNGSGQPGRGFSWTGINERGAQSLVPPGGPYYVKIRVAGGVVEDNSLQIFMSTSASIYGTVNSTGAYAFVQAQGAGASYLNYALADANGNFQVYGLQNGGQYSIVATTGAVINGAFTPLVSSSFNVTASMAGTNIGPIPFPTPTTLRVRVGIPGVAPYDFTGSVNAHTADFSQQGWGTLHYLPGADKSDNGLQSFGASASTWTVMTVRPGTYTLELNLNAVGLSSTVPSVVVSPGVNNDVALTLQRLSNVYGFAAAPSSPSFNTSISIQAQKAGANTPGPSAGVPLSAANPGPYTSSGSFALYGLDPGTWTITARASGFGASSTTIVVSTSDIGTLSSPGVTLNLGVGGVLNGVLQLVGDSRGLANASNGGVNAYVFAYNPGAGTGGSVQVFVATSATLASSTFSITGLDNGGYFVAVNGLQGTQPVSLTTNVVSGSGFTTLQAAVVSARALVNLKMPLNAAPTDYQNVSLYYYSGDYHLGNPVQLQSLGAGTTMQYFLSSATLQTPTLGGGVYMFQAYYNKTGAFDQATVPVITGATSYVVLDLTKPTFPVTGQVQLSGAVSFPQTPPAAAVSISSIAGLSATSAVQSYCLPASGVTLTTSVFHAELMPIAQDGSFQDNTLEPASNVGGNCALPTLYPGNMPREPNPFMGYESPINADGSYAFPGVPPGTYLLRIPPSLDGGGADIIPPTRRIVTVATAAVSGVNLAIGPGVAVSGQVKMPPGVSASGSFSVMLNDSHGITLKMASIQFANSGSAPYSFDHVPDGTYALLFLFNQYMGGGYGARPVLIKVAGAPLTQDIQLAQTGVVKGRFAVQQYLTGGTTGQYTPIDSRTIAQLPPSLQIFATADPWFQGGLFPSNGQGFGEMNPPSLDANGQFTISAMLPGLYDVHFEAQNDSNDRSTVRVARASAPGVTVRSAGVTDIGTIVLNGAQQIQGQAYDAVTSSPIANLLITAQPAASQNKSIDHPVTFTDASGHYTLVGLDPTVKLYDIFAGRHNSLSTLPYELKVAPAVDVTSVSVVNFAMSPANYSISGMVVGSAGGPPLLQPFAGDASAPPAGAMVFVQRAGVQPRDNPLGDTIQPTDSQGRFTIPALATGTFKVTIVAIGYGSSAQFVQISSASVNLGVISLAQGAGLSGALHKPDGSNPGQNEVDTVVAVTNDLGQILSATLTTDPNTRVVSGYSISGFQPGLSYRVMIRSRESGAMVSPVEARNIVFSTTTESRSLDIVLRPAPPFVFSKSKRVAGGFKLRFELSQPLRNRGGVDNNVSTILSTFSAAGVLSQIQLDPTRSVLTALYAPGVGESSYTLQLQGYSVQTDPDSIDPVNPQFVYSSTFGFFAGIDGYYSNVMSNFSGGTMLVEDDPGRVAIPSGAFFVDASSSVSVGYAIAQESLAGAATSGLRGAAANIKAMRYSGGAYPQEIFRAMAATPPQVSPLSSFYNILLPLGLRAALQKPVPLTISYSTSTDPTTLNLYWYNAAANAYVLQQDVTGAQPVIDPVNHTITINVNHFSTFVLFNTGVAVISGNAFSGDFTAYNFPNPFDLSVKTVTAIHGPAAQTVRGTMISIGLPPDISGDGSIRIYNVAGERVRTMSLGTLSGGQYFYQPWDGRNDSGRDVASGVYIGQVKVGSHSKFFKMALIK